MERLFAIAATGAAQAAIPAHAGSIGLDELSEFVHGPDTVAGCLQEHYLRLPAARAKKGVTCILRHGSNGKSVTRKQWVARGLPKEEPEL